MKQYCCDMQKVCQFGVYVEFTNYIALNYCCNIATPQNLACFLRRLKLKKLEMYGG